MGREKKTRRDYDNIVRGLHVACATQILTDTNVIRQAANVNVSDAFLLQLTTQRGIGKLFVVPKHRVRIDFRVGSLVYFHATVDDLNGVGCVG